MADEGLDSIPPCNGAEPSHCSSKSLIFPYILIPFLITVFFPWNSLNLLSIPVSTNMSLPAVLFSMLCTSLADVLSHSVSSRLSRCLRILSPSCAAGLCQNQPLAHARPQPGEEDCKWAPRSNSNCRHTSASCCEMLKTGMFFSRERRCSSASLWNRDSAPDALNHDFSYFSSLCGKGRRWDCYHPLV